MYRVPLLWKCASYVHGDLVQVGRGEILPFAPSIVAGKDQDVSCVRERQPSTYAHVHMHGHGHQKLKGC